MQSIQIDPKDFNGTSTPKETVKVNDGNKARLNANLSIDTKNITPNPTLMLPLKEKFELLWDQQDMSLTSWSKYYQQEVDLKNQPNLAESQIIGMLEKSMVPPAKFFNLEGKRLTSLKEINTCQMEKIAMATGREKLSYKGQIKMLNLKDQTSVSTLWSTLCDLSEKHIRSIGSYTEHDKYLEAYLGYSEWIRDRILAAFRKDELFFGELNKILQKDDPIPTILIKAQKIEFSLRTVTRKGQGMKLTKSKKPQRLK